MGHFEISFDYVFIHLLKALFLLPSKTITFQHSFVNTITYYYLIKTFFA